MLKAIGGILKHELVANLLPSLTVEKFWKSFNIWWSYGQLFSVFFFSDYQCTLLQQTQLCNKIVGYMNQTFEQQTSAMEISIIDRLHYRLEKHGQLLNQPQLHANSLLNH